MTVPAWELLALWVIVWALTAAAALWLRRRDRLRDQAAAADDRRDAALCAEFFGIDWDATPAERP